MSARWSHRSEAGSGLGRPNVISPPRRPHTCYRGPMEDQTATIVRLRREIEEGQYSLETLGGAKRLAQRDRIADSQRKLRLLLEPADLASAGTQET